MAGVGRKKGQLNKVTRTIKEAIEKAFDEVGGPAYLARMAEEQPVAFMTLLGKILPNKIEHAGQDGKDLAPAVAIFALPDNGRDR